jgi:hypothetical protein
MRETHHYILLKTSFEDYYIEYCQGYRSHHPHLTPPHQIRDLAAKFPVKQYTTVIPSLMQIKLRKMVFAS